MPVNTLAQFPFVDLPAGIDLLILTYAARPIFSQTGPHWCGRSYYSSALALCCVSRTVRRIILPELLHTVFLVEARHVLDFMRALNMQSAYAQQQNHLHVDYAAHVHKIWISKILGSSLEYTVPRSDFSLLAPVLLAAQSLALDFASLPLLNGCLEYAWNSHIALNIDQQYSHNLPWGTRALTILEYSPPIELSQPYPLTNTVQERAFLASISHIITLPLIMSNVYHGPDLDGDRQLYYILPKWMDRFPWASLKSLRAVSVVLPHVTIVAPFHELAPLQWKDMPVELLTFSAPEDLLSGNWTRKDLDAYAGRGEFISSVNACGCIVRDSDPSSVALEVFLDWEQAWAHGIRE